MRFWLVLLMFFLSLLPTTAVIAHLADEFPQVTLQIAIDDEAVQLIVGIPAKDASIDVLDGLSPVAMDQMEPADLSAMVGRLFAKRCPVTIDGVVVPPMVLGAVVRMQNSRLPARRFPEAQVLKQGTLKFFVRYETKGTPSSVSLDWSIFANEYDENNQPIHAADGLQVVGVVKAAGREQIVLLTPSEPGYTWHDVSAREVSDALLTEQPIERNYFHVPIPSIVIALTGVVCGAFMLGRSKSRVIGLVVFSFVAAGVCLPYGNLQVEHTTSRAALDDDDALAIFESLHRNIYRAFDYTDEGAVYDALAQSVDGPMLETIYNDVYQSLIMREQNGAVSKVVRVEIDRAVVMSIDEAIEAAHGSSAYRVTCEWQVDGLVTHYGHSHARTNAFNAVYTVALRGEGWRIVDAEILDQRRIDDGQQSPEDVFEAS